jgi:hypothetical protein
MPPTLLGPKFDIEPKTTNKVPMNITANATRNNKLAKENRKEGPYAAWEVGV